MATLCSNDNPSIVTQQFEYIPHFHDGILYVHSGCVNRLDWKTPHLFGVNAGSEGEWVGIPEGVGWGMSDGVWGEGKRVEAAHPAPGVTLLGF